MTEFVVAIFNNHTGELKQSRITAPDELLAGTRVLQQMGYAIPDEDYVIPEDLDKLNSDCLNWELNLSVLEI